MFAYRMTNFLADITTNVSVDAVAAFESKGAVRRGQMLMVPNGINTDKFVFKEQLRSTIRDIEGVKSDEKVILAVGRLAEAKNYAGLLQAFAILCSSDDSTRLWVIGDGGLKESLVALASKLKISHRIKFFGVREDVADFYGAADVYVLSSLWEGFGLVVAEAMATERVVVATDCGGVKKVVGNHGVLVHPGDSEELATALRLALDMDPLSAKAMGRLARQRIVDNYSLDKVVKSWIDLYTT